MPTVEPHLYRDTPIFREMLYERDGRYPGTPEGEEPIEISLGPDKPLQGPPTHVPEPVEPGPSQEMLSRLTAVQPLLAKAVAQAVPVVPILPPADPQETQPMKLPDFGEDPDDEVA